MIGKPYNERGDADHDFPFPRIALDEAVAEIAFDYGGLGQELAIVEASLMVEKDGMSFAV